MRAIILGVGIAAITGIAEACKCLPPESVESEYHNASAVFVGRVESVSSPLSLSRLWSGTEESTLVVMKAWKGVSVGDRIKARSNLATDCGRPAKQDQSPASEPIVWIVYGEGAPPYSLDFCSRTQPAGGWTKEEEDALDEIVRRQ